MSLSGLILAAGASSRMGTPKALVRLGEETFLDRLIAAFVPSCRPIIVVLGHHADLISTGILRASEVAFVRNPQPERGQLSSLQHGLRALPPDTEGVIFTPVDYPAISPRTVQALADRFRCRESELIVVPCWHGKHGHPVCCAPEVIEEFLCLPDNGQARDVVRRHRSRTCYVEVDDPAIVEDADDLEAYQRLLRMFSHL